jgi:DNA-binding ferritin-like protein
MKLTLKELKDLAEAGGITKLDSIRDGDDPEFKRMFQDTQEVNAEVLKGILDRIQATENDSHGMIEDLVNKINTKQVKSMWIHRDSDGLIDRVDVDYGG